MKSYLLHTFCFLFFSIGLAQNTYIPDDNFEQALIELGYDSGSLDDYVPTANINTITFLPVSGRDISDFTGIEDFSALDRLNCNNNIMTSLDVSQNANLQFLLASDCDLLTSVNLGQSTTLKQIDIWRSGLTSLDITQNTGLLQVNVPNNNLTTLDVTQNAAMTRLHIGGNTTLNSIDVSLNTNLNNFHCNNTGMTSIDVTALTNLRYFVFSWNNITDIDLSQNANLETVYCEVTDLTAIDLSNSPLLKRLTAGGTDFYCINLDNDATWRLQTVQITTDNLSCIKVSDITQVSPYLAGSGYYSETCACTGDALSVDDFFDTDISVYPNPTLGNLQIELKKNTQLKNIEIYNIHGQLVKTLSTQKIKIDDLSSGIYLMRITTNKGTLIKKIIKK